jgi:threonine/homoserine/homoserine lactone efflux protein
MADWISFAVFLAAALVIALTPGPGILYVAARTLAGGREEGVASVLGTGLGGFVHVTAGALGVSALVLASAEAFTVLKFLGALYLVYLGIKTWRAAKDMPELSAVAATGGRRAFREGVMVEALNPKTAAFFLAFIPQFVDLHHGSVALQFAALGVISVTLNTAVDVAVVYGATSLRARLLHRPGLIRRLRQSAAGIMCLLGVSLALTRRPS